MQVAGDASQQDLRFLQLVALGLVGAAGGQQSVTLGAAGVRERFTLKRYEAPLVATLSKLELQDPGGVVAL